MMKFASLLCAIGASAFVMHVSPPQVELRLGDLPIVETRHADVFMTAEQIDRLSDRQLEELGWYIHDALQRSPGPATLQDRLEHDLRTISKMIVDRSGECDHESVTLHRPVEFRTWEDVFALTDDEIKSLDARQSRLALRALAHTGSTAPHDDATHRRMRHLIDTMQSRISRVGGITLPPPPPPPMPGSQEAATPVVPGSWQTIVAMTPEEINAMTPLQARTALQVIARGRKRIAREDAEDVTRQMKVTWDLLLDRIRHGSDG